MARKGNAAALRRFWASGGKGRVSWGRHGDFAACVRHVGKYINNPQGYCALRHKEATGKWPGRGKGRGH
jgi:hypothetical protein